MSVEFQHELLAYSFASVLCISLAVRCLSLRVGLLSIFGEHIVILGIMLFSLA